MVAEVLPPGVENSGHAQGRLEVVPSELQQGRRSTGEQQGVEADLVVPDERVQFVRQRKNDVEIGMGSRCSSVAPATGRR